MAAFVRNLVQRVVSATSGGSPYDVKDGDPCDLDKYLVLCQDQSQCFTLYQDGSVYSAVLYDQRQYSRKYFSLFRIRDVSEARDMFNKFSYHLLPLSSVIAKFYDCGKLQMICDCIRCHIDWSTAHIAAHLGIAEAFRNNFIACQVNMPCGSQRLTPLHVAIAANQEACIRELLITPVDLSLTDSQGSTVFHVAAHSSTPAVIRLLACKNQQAINLPNGEGESPLHTAALSNKHGNIEALLMNGADPCMTRSTRFPIHCALKMNNLSCAQALCKYRAQLALAQDDKFRGTPMHWVKSREAVELLVSYGCPVNQVNARSESPLHVVIKLRRPVECAVALLSREANPSMSDDNGNTPLHLALQTDDIDLVRTLVVFGADVNKPNNAGITPRHMAATGTGVNSEENASTMGDIHVYTLCMTGALRCPKQMTGCSKGCKAGGTFNGYPQGNPIQTNNDHQKKFYDHLLGVAAVAALAGQSTSFNNSEGMDVVDAPVEPPIGHRVLCLDGGGIRGLILVEILQAIEKAAGRPIKDCFDWISGTSTGGILALALVHGKSVQYCQGMYFRMKDKVFSGTRPYNSEPLEEVLKTEFGEHTKMMAVTRPRVIVTGVLGDRLPAELHLFRNYEKPMSSSSPNGSPENNRFKKTLSPHEQLVWRAARCSGAAPTYFRSSGRFLDGGLIANNPTLDTLTEIHEHNMELKASNQSHMAVPVGIVVSLGTGRFPVEAVAHSDVFIPKGVVDLFHVGFGASALGKLLVDQATQAEGRVVDRARAWCSMINVPFFRFSPLLSQEIPLDCRDDKILTRALWETQCYLHQNQDKIDELAKLLVSR